MLNLVEKLIIITNNPLSKEFFNDKYEVQFVNGSLMDVLIKTRDLIHKGYVLLTHPLMGSVKPNQTPYKTVAISKLPKDKTDEESVLVIENSILTAQKLIKSKPYKKWPEEVLEDFRVIDLDLIKSIF